MKIFGFNHSKGEYQGHQFDNLQLFGTIDNLGKEKWVCEKCPVRVLQDAGFKDFNVLKGLEIDLFYNKYGKIEKVGVK